MGVRRPAWWCYPERCQNGHEWGPGLITVSWVLCDCPAARAASGVVRPGIWRCSATRRRAAGRCGTGPGTSPEGNKNGVPGGDCLRRPSLGDDGALAVWQAGASIHCAPLPAGPIQTRQAAMRLNVSPLARLTVLLSTYRRDR